jgi:mannose-1-phosphate guanylyltransferase
MEDSAAGNGANGYCVIMAGGRGTRFWPLSRSLRPKQLLALSSPQSLIRETCDRILPLVGPERVIVITNENLLTVTRRELPELPTAHIIGEPCGRNTAPCAALGIGLADRLSGKVPVALLPADHWIPDGEKFRDQLSAAFHYASSTGQPVTFGIPPSRPETGYGYLEVRGDASPSSQPPVAEAGVAAILPGRRFVEKPDADTARSYLSAGHYYWNSGIFVWDSRTFAAKLAEHLPAVAGALAEPLAVFGQPDFTKSLAEAYDSCPAISIDFGVMEKLSSFAVIPAVFRWSDIGSWDVWGELAPEVAAGNRGLTRLLELDSHGNIIYAPEKTVALVGVDDFIIVDTKDALLVCRVEDAQRIREITERLADEDKQELL